MMLLSPEDLFWTFYYENDFCQISNFEHILLFIIGTSHLLCLEYQLLWTRSLISFEHIFLKYGSEYTSDTLIRFMIVIYVMNKYAHKYLGHFC